MPTLKEFRQWAAGGRVEGLPEPQSQQEGPRKVSDKMAERLAELKQRSAASAGQVTGRYKISADGTDALIKFGKHSGKTLRQIANEDPTYLEWILRANDDPQRAFAAFDEALLDVVRYVQEDHFKQRREERRARRARDRSR